MKPKKAEAPPNDLIYLLALGILDNLSGYIEEYEREIAYISRIAESLEHYDPEGVELDRELLIEIRKKIEDEQSQKELYFKNNEWHQYIEDKVEINDCFEKILARIYAGESMDDLECEIVSSIGGMDDRDWVNPDWGNYKNRIVKNACFYCACSMVNEQIGAPIQAIQDLLQAAEITGSASRLGPEVYRSIFSSTHRFEGAKIAQQGLEKTRRVNSEDGNIKKNRNHAAKMQFAKEKWLEMPELHDRTAGEIADKIIAEFKKSVPAKDTLRRLISVLKLQSKN